MKMIAAFRPRLLVMVGICAGVRNECDIGDILLADPTWDWQMGKYVDGEFLIAPDQIDVPPVIGELFRLMGDDVQLWFDIHRCYPGIKPSNLPAAGRAPVTSGSSVLADPKVIEMIKKQNRKLVGIDMELYGMYAAARDCAPPNPIAFGLKSICDFADATKNNNFQPYAAYTSVKALEAFCTRFGDAKLFGE